MTHSVHTILTDIYDAWRAHNLDWLATYLPDDFSHSINIPTEMHPLGGKREGKKAAVARIGLIFEQFDTQQLEMSHVALNATGAAVEVQTRCRHRQSGVWLDTIKSNVWAIEDGWPVRLDEHYDIARFQVFMTSASGR